MVRHVSLHPLLPATGDDRSTLPNRSISGMNWVAEEAVRTGLPSVASMSLGGSASISIDRAVKAVCAEWMEYDSNATDKLHSP